MGVEESTATSRRAVVTLVYLAFVVDNMLLTVVVPILPEDLARMEIEDKPIFELPAVVIHQPNLLKTELTNEKIQQPNFKTEPTDKKIHQANTTRIELTPDKLQQPNLFETELALKKIKKPSTKLRNSGRDESSADWNVVDQSDKTHLNKVNKRGKRENNLVHSPQRLSSRFLNQPVGVLSVESLPCENVQRRQKVAPFTIPCIGPDLSISAAFSALSSLSSSINSSLELDKNPTSTSTNSSHFPRSQRFQPPMESLQTLKTEESSPALPIQPLKFSKSSVTSNSIPLMTSNPETLLVEIDEEEEEDVEREVGLVLAVRSLVQLMVTPFVAKWSAAVGYTRPMIIGCCILLASTITFACARSVVQLALARSLHGLASSCIVITGLGLVASHYPSDAARGRMLGRVQGGVALGVVLGYPTGGLLYHLTDSPAPPFVLLAGGAGLLVGAMIAVLKPWRDVVNPLQGQREGVLKLVTDAPVATACTAICAATAAFPVLESCLPSHLRATIHPERWELGAMFLPDSLGYFAAASLLPGPAYAFGRPRAAAACCLLVAIATFVVPYAGSVGALALPHLGVGVGVGGVDAALLPLLAAHVDTRRPNAHYAAVYALAQSAVAGAYCIGPVLGVWVAGRLGFPWAMRLLALCNLAMCPLLLRGLSSSATTPETAAVLETRPQQHELKERKYESLP